MKHHHIQLILVITILLICSFYFIVFEINCITAIRNELKRENKNFKYNAAKQLGDLDESSLDFKYKVKNPQFDEVKNEILKFFEPCEFDKSNISYELIWNEANSVS